MFQVSMVLEIPLGLLCGIHRKKRIKNMLYLKDKKQKIKFSQLNVDVLNFLTEDLNVCC